MTIRRTISMKPRGKRRHLVSLPRIDFSKLNLTVSVLDDKRHRHVAILGPSSKHVGEDMLLASTSTDELGHEGAKQLADLFAAAPKLLLMLKKARECIAYCRRAHKDAQSGDGFPIEIFIDEAIAEAEGKPSQGIL